MIEMDPHNRIDPTGSWAGLGFQGEHMFTPEGHQFEPCDMAWCSLTRNIARERLPGHQLHEKFRQRRNPASST